MFTRKRLKKIYEIISLPSFIYRKYHLEFCGEVSLAEYSERSVYKSVTWSTPCRRCAENAFDHKMLIV